MSPRAFVLLLGLSLACQATPNAAAPSAQGEPSARADADTSDTTTRNDPMDKLQAWIALRGQTQEQLVQSLRLDPSLAQPDRAYEGLRGVTDLHDPAHHPASFYLRDGRAALIYVSDRAALQGLTEAAFLQAWGEPALTLRSRAGKASVMLVYPERGVAFSSEQQDDTIEFVEIFAPMSAQEYQLQIYVDPGPFHK